MANKDEIIRALSNSPGIAALSNPPRKDVPKDFRGDTSGNVQQGVANSLQLDYIPSPSLNFLIQFPDAVTVDLRAHAVVPCQSPL